MLSSSSYYSAECRRPSQVGQGEFGTWYFSDILWGIYTGDPWSCSRLLSGYRFPGLGFWHKIIWSELHAHYLHDHPFCWTWRSHVQLCLVREARNPGKVVNADDSSLMFWNSRHWLYSQIYDKTHSTKHEKKSCMKRETASSYGSRLS